MRCNSCRSVSTWERLTPASGESSVHPRVPRHLRLYITHDLARLTFASNSLQRNGRVEIIANDQGNRITPSYVGFVPSTGERLIGDAAKNQAPSNPTNTIFDAKRLIGRRFDDKEVQRDLKHYPFKVKAGSMQQPVVEVKVGDKAKTFTAEEISAMILGKMKETAETYLGHKVTHAVVTVPA